MVTSLNIGSKSISMPNILKYIGYGLVFGGLATVLGLASYQAVKTSSNTPIERTYPTPEATPYIQPTPLPTSTPIIVPTPVPTPTPEPTPTIVPTPTVIPTPVLTAYEKFDSYLNKIEFDNDLKLYFTKELFDSIGNEKSRKLVSYVDYALDSSLGTLNSERISTIRNRIRKGPITNNDYRHEEHLQDELNLGNIEYGHEKEDLISLMEYISENNIDVNVIDISLYSDTFIKFKQNNTLEYAFEISRIVQEARKYDMSTYIDNKTLVKYFSTVASGAQWNKEYLISKGSNPEDLDIDLPMDMFSTSFFGYRTDNFRGAFQSAGIGGWKALKLNFDNAEKLLGGIQEFLLDYSDENFGKFFNPRSPSLNGKNKGAKGFLEGYDDHFPITQTSKDPLLELYDKSPEFRQYVQISAYSHLIKNDTHWDVAWYLTNIYSRLLGYSTVDIIPYYPIGHFSYGAVTQTAGIEFTPEIRRTFDEILGRWNVDNYLKEHLHNEFLSVPFWSAGFSKDEGIELIKMRRNILEHEIIFELPEEFRLNPETNN